MVKAALNECFGNPIVISEECFTSLDKRPENYWLIDPIDGTASWYNGFQGFVTQAALIHNGFPVYGVVYAPVFGNIWSAHKGRGAFLNGQQLPSLLSHDQLTLIDNYPEPRHIAHLIFDALKIQNYIECGSLGLKACFVADGRADIFIKDILFRDWDIAAADVILTELGGILSDLSGNPIIYNEVHEKKNGLMVVGQKKLQDRILAVLSGF